MNGTASVSNGALPEQPGVTSGKPLDSAVDATTSSLRQMSTISQETPRILSTIEQPLSNARETTEPSLESDTVPVKESQKQPERLIASSLMNDTDYRISAPNKGTDLSNKIVSSKDTMEIDVSTDADTSTLPDGHNDLSTKFADVISVDQAPKVDEEMQDAPATLEAVDKGENSSRTQRPGLAQDATPETNDHPDMSQGISIQTKLSRPRDDEISSNEPASKRVKSDDGDSSAIPEFKVPEASVAASASPDAITADVPDQSLATDVPTAPIEAQADPAVTNGNARLSRPQDREQNPNFDTPMTKPQQKHLQRGLVNLKKNQHALPFTNPVDYVALNIPTYPDIVKNPMDLKTMDQKLKDDKYRTVAEYINDFDQMVLNTVLFNGEAHGVTQHAFQLRIAFDRNISTLPGQDYMEPTAAEKKAKKAAVPKPPPRRESRSSLGNAKSPTASSPQTTFALGPSGVPLIRRDSTVADGRPKREIHPPAPKDLPYSASKPKRKKFQLELKFCQEVLTELKRPKYTSISQPFLQPVDPVSLNIPNYHKVIKKPMDISTIHRKLEAGQYENAKEFEGDVRQMFQNCYKFNPADHPIHKLGKDYEKIFDEKWAQKAKWLNDHGPNSEAQSPGSFTEADDEEDEEEEPEEEEEDDNDQISELQKSIVALSQQIDTLKKGKRKSPPAASKKSKAAKPPKKEVKKTQTAKANKKGTGKRGGQQKARIMSYDEKRAISDRINDLPEGKIPQVLQIIRENMPGLKVSFSIFSI